MIPLNLKTTSGRCQPLPLGNNSDVSGIVIPTGVHAGSLFTRPPLRDRACCAGDDGQAQPEPVFSIEEGAGPEPVSQPSSWPAGVLNLRTTSGGCTPLPVAQPSVGVVNIPASGNVSILWTRPPLRDRACCAGDDGQEVSLPIFIYNTGCRYFGLEDGQGLFALEDESGYIALECAL